MATLGYTWIWFRANKNNSLVVSTYPSEKYAKVSWDDDIPNIWKVIKIHGSSHHQPDKIPMDSTKPSWIQPTQINQTTSSSYIPIV